MQSIRKKILLDLFVTPWTVLPFVGGVSLLMLSTVLGGMAAFLGFLGCLFALGALLTNVTFNLKAVTQKAVEDWQKQQQKKKDKDLDGLYKKLMATKGKDDEDALENLRSLYHSFTEDLKQGQISNSVPMSLIQQIDEIFEHCIAQFQLSYDCWRMASKTKGKVQKKLNQQRKEILEQIEAAIMEFAETINEVRALKFKSNKSELGRLQGKLKNQLEVVKTTEERLANLNNEPDFSEYAQYE